MIVKLTYLTGLSSKGWALLHQNLTMSTISIFNFFNEHPGSIEHLIECAPLLKGQNVHDFPGIDSDNHSTWFSFVFRLAIEKWFPAMCFFTIAIYSGSVALSRLVSFIFQPMLIGSTYIILKIHHFLLEVKLLALCGFLYLLNNFPFQTVLKRNCWLHVTC